MTTVTPDSPGFHAIAVDRHLTPPTATGWGDQFNGDNSRGFIQLQYSWTQGPSDPMGPVGTTYRYAPHITPIMISGYIGPGVGHNSTTFRNGPGRTGVTMSRLRLSHFGQGDAAAYNASVFVGGQEAGATHYLAQPAGSILNGDISAGAPGVYLNTFETIARDNGHDVSSIAFVANLVRTNDTGALNTRWNGFAVQSQGTRAVDSAYRADGPFHAVFDASRALGQGGVVLRQGQRIYFQAEANAERARADLGDTYVSHDGAGVTFVVGGVTVMRMTPTGIQTFVPVTP